MDDIYDIPVREWYVKYCWVPERIGAESLIRSPPNVGARIYRIPQVLWDISSLLPANKHIKARRYIMVSQLQCIVTTTNDDDPMEITLPMELTPPPPISTLRYPRAFHVYTQSGIQAFIVGQQNSNVSFDDVDRLVWTYAQALAEISVYLETNTYDEEHMRRFFETYSVLFDHADSLTLVRMFIVLHVIPRVAALSVNIGHHSRQEIWLGARENLPFALTQYFKIEKCICKWHAYFTLVKNPCNIEFDDSRLVNVGEDQWRILSDLALESGTKENVTTVLLAEKVLPSLHVYEIKRHSLGKGLLFLDAESKKNNIEGRRMWLLFDEIAKALLLAFSHTPDVYFAQHAFHPGAGGPMANGQLIENFHMRRAIHVPIIGSVHPNSWRPPSKYDARKLRLQNAGLPDIEDLGKNVPPCMQQVIVKTRSSGHLYNDARYAMATWLAHAAPTASHGNLFHLLTYREQMESENDRYILGTIKSELAHYQKPEGPNKHRHYITCFKIIQQQRTRKADSVLYCPYAQDDEIPIGNDDKMKDYVHKCQRACSDVQGYRVYDPTDGWLFAKETVQ